MTHLPETDRIVVGVDGSAASLAALLWAADEAELRHAELVAVRAWRASREWLAPYAVAAARPSPGQERERARSGLAADVRRTLGPAPRVPVRQELVRGEGARALISRAAGARLLVLGGRPDGPSPDVPPGPVASACLRHPPCPVVLVPPVYVPEERAHGTVGAHWQAHHAGRTSPDTMPAVSTAGPGGAWPYEDRGRFSETLR
ncbi:universal stress protein [Actinomadura sp. NPDC048394]|jgi:nucleotide-binding universal stress UspA family protein|uniref:universal stress protein n=1 Tax=Actinomadura sp. NPDC048394 TaxID=3158223 RepID=UPI0033C0E5BB